MKRIIRAPRLSEIYVRYTSSENDTSLIHRGKNYFEKFCCTSAENIFSEYFSLAVTVTVQQN